MKTIAQKIFLQPIFFLFILITLFSCSSERNTLDSYIGQSKNKLEKDWGQPYKITADTGKGEALVYLVHTNISKKSPEYKLYSSDSKKQNDYYRIMYIHPDSTIYYWATMYTDGGVIEHREKKNAKQ